MGPPTTPASREDADTTGATAPCSPLAHTALSDTQADELEQVFKALADRHRVKILNRVIAAGEDAVCVCEFTDTLELKPPTVS